MNFEDMKSAWQQDSGGDIELPDQLETIKKAKSPVEKVKKNIRMEMWTSLVCFVVLFAFPLFYDHLLPQVRVFYYTILIMTLIPMSYYFYNFYKFYGRLNKLELSTKDNVEDAYFDLKYSIEMYKVMQHFILPNYFLLGLVIGAGGAINLIIERLLNFNNLVTIEKLPLILLGLFILLTFVGFFYLIKFYTQYLYGKYLDELRKIRESLREGV